MYAINSVGRMLIVTLSLVTLISLVFSARQLSYVNHYKTIATNAQEVLQTLLEIEVFDPENMIKLKQVNAVELRCMAENIYFEAGNQSLAGKMAVGHVVLNRMANSRYPRTACGVINQKVRGTCMFSWKCEESKAIRDRRAWSQSQKVAYELLSKERKDLIDITEGATHFHAVYVNPGWNLRKVAQIDDHLFYK
jgi:spore germination cell wall hydrolase CwlJ-like protein